MRTLVLVLLFQIVSAASWAANVSGYWYYCEPAHAYYPYVKTCPAPWIRVAPRGASTQSPASTPTPVTPSQPAPSTSSQITPPASGQAGQGVTGSHDDDTAVLASTTDSQEDSGSIGIWLLVLIAGAASLFVVRHLARKARRKRLMEKYGNAELVEAILNRKVLQGMTREQLYDSWGRPVETGHEIYKKTVRETFKYDRTGRNRFKKRVYLENGIVVGWKEN